MAVPLTSGAHDAAYVAAVEAIYAAAAEPADWPDALQVIADCFHGNAGATLIYRRDDGSTAVIVSPGIEAAAEAYNREWWRHDLRLARSRERGYLDNLDTITDRHVVSEEEIATHPFYAEYLVPHGLGWFAGTTLSPDPGGWVGLSLQRPLARPAFSDGELALLARIGRHAENALRLSIRLITAEMASLTLGDALARLGVGVFFLDGLGRVVFANPFGERLIGDGLTMAQARLGARYGRESDALNTAIRAVIEEGPARLAGHPRPVLVHGLTTDDDFLAVYVLPVTLPSARPLDRLLAGARAIVLAIPSRAQDAADPAVVRDLLDVTLAEARLASLIGAGLAPREAAQKLGVTEETARTTLKRVFQKTGVSRQSELATLLTRLVLR